MPRTAPIIEAAGQGSLLAVLVLYQCGLAESPAYRSFRATAADRGLDPVHLAVYDNSPVRRVSPAEETELLSYHHNPSNGGLAAAYNWALSLSAPGGIEWLLLLDQDSDLPTGFFREMCLAAGSYAPNPQVAAIIPHVLGASGPVSPSWVRIGRLAAVREDLCGVVRQELTAVNSGTLVRTAFVRSLGGFDSDFPLDWLDHWLFHEIYASGKSVAVLNLTLQHDLSVQNYRNTISAARLRSILASEILFLTRHKSRSERFIHALRLFARAAKHLLVYRNPGTACLVLGALAHMLPWTPRPGRCAP